MRFSRDCAAEISEAQVMPAPPGQWAYVRIRFQHRLLTPFEREIEMRLRIAIAVEAFLEGFDDDEE